LGIATSEKDSAFTEKELAKKGLKVAWEKCHHQEEEKHQEGVVPIAIEQSKKGFWWGKEGLMLCSSRTIAKSQRKHKAV